MMICIPLRDTSSHQDSAGKAPSGTPPPAQPPPPPHLTQTRSTKPPRAVKLAGPRWGGVAIQRGGRVIPKGGWLIHGRAARAIRRARAQRKYQRELRNHSIKATQSHTRARRSRIPAPSQRAANPASQKQRNKALTLAQRERQKKTRRVGRETRASEGGRDAKAVVTADPPHTGRIEAGTRAFKKNEMMAESCTTASK